MLPCPSGRTISRSRSRRRTSCCTCQARCLTYSSSLTSLKCNPKASFARLLQSRLQVNAAFCGRRGSQVIRYLKVAVFSSALLGCAPESASTYLVRGRVHLDERPFVITLHQPLPPRGTLPALCVGTPAGYRRLALAALDAGEARPPTALWSALVGPRGDTVQFEGTITLVSGATHRLALIHGLMRGDACLLVQPSDQLQDHPLPAAVRQIRLWSTAPIDVPAIYWTEGIS